MDWVSIGAIGVTVLSGVLAFVYGYGKLSQKVVDLNNNVKALADNMKEIDTIANNHLAHLEADVANIKVQLADLHKKRRA